MENQEEVTLMDIVECAWMQKQFDDMLCAHADVKNSMKGRDQFNPKYIDRRDKLAHDLNVLQPVLRDLGIKIAKHIEKKYNIEFMIIKPMEEPKKPSMILTPDQKT